MTPDVLKRLLSDALPLGREASTALKMFIYRAMDEGLTLSQIDHGRVADRFHAVYPETTRDEFIRLSKLHALARDENRVGVIYARVREVLDLADRIKWHVPSRWFVLRAMCDAQLESKITPFGASHRRVADAAGITKDTATRCLDDLVEDGWLVRHGQKSNATTLWTVEVPPYRAFIAAGRDSRPAGFRRGIDSLTVPTHDAFRHRALGIATRRVMDVLQHCAVSVSADALADFLFVSTSTARRHLRKLEGHGLAEEIRPDRWRAVDVPVTSLDIIAERLNAAGVGERQRRRHERERERYDERGRTHARRPS